MLADKLGFSVGMFSAAGVFEFQNAVIEKFSRREIVRVVMRSCTYICSESYA